MAHEELQQARQLINKGRYDEAREILESLNHPTAIQWLEKLNRMTTSTLSENSNRHAAENEAKVERVVKESGVKEGIRFGMIATFSLALLAFVVAVYGTFAKPGGVAQAEAISISLNEQLKGLSSDILSFQKNINDQLTEVQSNLDVFSSAVTTTSVIPKWEYLGFNYSQMDSDLDGDRMELMFTGDSYYDELIMAGIPCDLDDRDFENCMEREFRGSSYYLNILGQEGWELFSVTDKSSEYVYSVEMLFKRQSIAEPNT